MAMRNPPHPGGIVRRQCLDPLGLSVTEAARGLGVTRQALSDVVSGPGHHFGRYGHAVVQGVRLIAGDVAWPADGLRPLAGAQQPTGAGCAALQGCLSAVA